MGPRKTHDKHPRLTSCLHTHMPPPSSHRTDKRNKRQKNYFKKEDLCYRYATKMCLAAHANIRERDERPLGEVRCQAGTQAQRIQHLGSEMKTRNTIIFCVSGLINIFEAWDLKSPIQKKNLHFVIANVQLESIISIQL